MHKKIYYPFFVVLFLHSSISLQAEDWEGIWDCAYASQFEQCVVANQNGRARSITDFVCYEWRDPNKILDQIIIDMKFQEIDTEIVSYLEGLEDDKERALYQPNELINEIVYNLSKEGEYYKRYKEICQSWMLTERLSCSEEIPNVVGANYLDGGSYDSRVCMDIVNMKIDIFEEIAYNVTALNKSTVLIDAKQLFKQDEKERYHVLMDLIRAILGFLERFANGVTHWTPNPK